MISIALDGPAGAGKSTIAKAISEKLGIVYLDTGAMYRTVALKAFRENIDSLDHENLSEMIKNINMEVRIMNKQQYMFLDDKDVSEEIRTPAISIGASNVALVPEVRIKMTNIQREFASKNDVVMEGRDIGSYVLPNATLKVFLTASLEKRAERRHKQLIANGNSQVSIADVKKDIEYRDMNDSNRNFAPLVKAKDAIEIDTTYLTIEQVIEKISSNIGKC